MKRTFQGFPLPILGILSFWIIGGKDYGEAIIMAFIGGLMAAHLYVKQNRVWEGREFIISDLAGRKVGILSAESQESLPLLPRLGSKIRTMPALTFFHPDGEKGLMLYLHPEGEPKGSGLCCYGKNGQQRVGCGILGNKGIGLYVHGNECGEPGIQIEIPEGKAPVIGIKNEKGKLLWNSPIEKTVQ